MPRKTTAIGTLRAVRDNPALPALIQSLPARDLAQLCTRIGVRDALEIMALAPVQRLAHALESSVWKTPRPGASEAFDPRELIEWIGAWLEIGNEFAAAGLAVIPDEQLTLYLSQVATITTRAMWGFERSTEIGDLDRVYAPSHDEKLFGPYVVSARRQEDWETVRSALDAMWSDAPERLLRLFGQLSGDESMLAPQRNRKSSNDDVIAKRGSVRESRGFVTASGARAFLALARRPFEELAEMREYDLETRRHLRGLAGNVLRDTDRGAPNDGDNGRAAGRRRGTAVNEPPLQDTDAGQLAVLHAALEEAGLLDPTPGRLLLAQDGASKPLTVVKLLRELAVKAPAEFDARAQELAYISSVLIAGIAVEGAPLSPADARSAALATCNLGLEILSSRSEHLRIDCEPGLVRPLLVGLNALRVLPRKVERTFVQCLEMLRRAEPEPLLDWLLEQAQVSVADLSDAVAKRDLEAAREATMALCFVFDPRACTAVLPLLDDLPRLGTAAGGAIIWIDSMAALASVAELLRGVDAKRHCPGDTQESVS